MQKLPTITIAEGQQTSQQPYRMLRRPVSLFLRACINRTCITAPVNNNGWNRLTGFARCTFWQALKACLRPSKLCFEEKTTIALLWRYINDKLELCIEYTHFGDVRMVPINHKVQFDKPFELRLRMPIFDKKHTWGYYLPPLLASNAKNKWSCKLRCTIGHQAKDPYGNKL